MSSQIAARLLIPRLKVQREQMSRFTRASIAHTPVESNTIFEPSVDPQPEVRHNGLDGVACKHGKKCATLCIVRIT